MLHVVMPAACQNLTFVKADMNQCMAHFAPFQNRVYFELCGLEHGLDEPQNSARIRTRPLKFFQAFGDILNRFKWLSETGVESRRSGNA